MVLEIELAIIIGVSSLLAFMMGILSYTIVRLIKRIDDFEKAIKPVDVQKKE